MAGNCILKIARVARTNITLRSIPVHLNQKVDILSCPNGEGESHVYILPVQHRKEQSRRDAKTMVEFIKPQLLFLELDEFRRDTLELEDSEQCVAYKAAQSLGIGYHLGDLDPFDEMSCKIKKTKELCRIHGEKDKKILEVAAKKMVHIDTRNLIMTYRLWKQAQKYSSILALVGRNHIFGMHHYWQMIKPKCLKNTCDAKS